MFVDAINDIERQKQKEEFKKYANALHDIYASFKESGFTSAQSLELVKQLIIVSFAQKNGNVNGKG